MIEQSRSNQKSRRSTGALLLLTAVGAVLIGLLPLKVVAQTSDDLPRELWRVGLHPFFGLIDQQASFSALPGVPSCCPGYEGGTGSEYGLGGSFEYLLTPAIALRTGVQFGFSTASFEETEQRLVTDNFDTTRASFLHSIDVQMTTVGLEGSVLYRPVAALGVMAGLRSDLLMSGTFDQEERIVEPSTIRYENDSRVRLVYNGSLPDAATLQVSILAGLRYDLPISQSKNWLLTPEIGLWQGLTERVNGIDWTSRGIRFGIGLQHVKYSTPEQPDTLDQILVPLKNDRKPSGS